MATETRLTAGAELDAEVERRIFGNDVCEWIGFNHHCKAAHPKPYSTDMAAAWLVVEMMREMGYSVSVESWIHGGWAAEIIPNEELFAIHGAGAHAVEDTAPLAICRAAIAALSAAEEPAGE